MSERTSYPPGAPCWVDLSTPDLERAEGFYRALFGWEVPELPDSAEMAGYRRAKLDGADVAGAMPLMEEGQPPAWSTYFSVADADATAAAVTANGGTQIAEPMDVSDYGRMAVFTDPEGAFFGTWEPGTFGGAQLVDEPGTLSWNELETRDPATARRFYGSVFGWEFEETEGPGGMAYSAATISGDRVAGIADIRGRVSDDLPAHWMTYFCVADAEAAVEKVQAGGGKVYVGPVEVPLGRFVMATDPWGAGFSMVEPNGKPPATAP